MAIISPPQPAVDPILASWQSAQSDHGNDVPAPVAMANIANGPLHGTGISPFDPVAQIVGYVYAPTAMVPSNWNNVTYLQFNGASAWHNIGVQKGADAELRIYNQDATPEQFTVEAVCTNVQPGVIVSLSSEDAAVKLHASATTATGHDIVSATTTLPGHFGGKIGIGFHTADGRAAKLAPGAQVAVRLQWLVPEKHPRHADAVRCFGKSAKREQPLRLSMGEFTFVGSKG